ncbi:uncharacterized protein LOC120200684 [Hibiscus syriacus]|uniref:uncharacterized protein LOC120200684 n=1 Tax=Hibiscus syriacus TaxID=106335 RepID=UPI00192455C4|nr:uncharacterized protein LOC120200684 [Hibiscus syriacus]
MAFRQYLRDFKPDLVVILEPRLSGGRADAFISATGFDRSHRIEADFVYDFGIRDIGFQGIEFTWNWGLSYARLDRALCNSKWDELYPETSIHHLHRMRSDHRPILICVGSSTTNLRQSQFRYFSGWLQHDDFNRMVKDNWVNSESLSDTISFFTNATDTWNKTVFGYIGTKKKIVMARLRGIHKSLNRRHSNFHINLETELLTKLEQLLDQEEILWKQRSRINWATQGYFPAIPSHLKDSMSIEPDDKEIYEALKDMAPLKAPGRNGLHAEFFQQQWHVVGQSVCSMVKNIFAGGDIEANLNKNVLVLIPKKEGPETFADLRPISLCIVMYKLITKIIVRRIKQVMPILIMLNQTSFVAGRSITENIIINQEVIHFMRQLKTKQGWMAIKVDLEKAFDCLQWEFIQDSLTEAGFPPCTIRLIMHCITSTSMQIQWNGEKSSAFQPERGIRQGDPLSPYLFILAMERLGHSIRKCVEEGDWKGYSFSRQGLSINHLFFADDLMLYAKADLHHEEIIEKTLKEFGYFSGHKVSKRKTHIYFLPNTTTSTKSSILSCLCFQEVESMGKYLGVPVLHRRMKITDFDFIFDKFRSKLNGWAARSLSLAGRITLTKSVLSAIPNYFMQVMPFPKRVYKNIKSRKLTLYQLKSTTAPHYGEEYRKYGDNYSHVWWSVGNGNSITFWNDNWVPSLGHLRDYARDDIHADLTQKIHNFVDVHGHWDVAALSQVFIPDVIPHVINVRPPDRNDKPDALIWRWTPELNFTIKSAYTFLMEDNWNEKSSIWKGVTYKTDSIIHSSYSWAKCYETNIRNPTARPRQQGATSTWSLPPRGWTCLNTDSAVATLDGRGSIGSVFRNSIGDWITGFTKNIGTTSALYAELWSIYEGLLIARSLGVLRLLTQSDCNRAVKLVEDSVRNPEATKVWMLDNKGPMDKPE